MATYVFRSEPAIDPTTNQLVTNGSGTIYDTDGNPLDVTDLSGSPMPQVATGPIGLTAEFMATEPEVVWRSGTYSVTMVAFSSLVESVTGAASDAASAASAAADAQTAAAASAVAAQEAQAAAETSAIPPTEEAVRDTLLRQQFAPRGGLVDAAIKGIARETLTGGSVGPEATVAATGSDLTGDAVRSTARIRGAAQILNGVEDNGGTPRNYWIDTAIRAGASKDGGRSEFVVEFDFDGDSFEFSMSGQEKALTFIRVWADGILVGDYAGNTGAVDGRRLRVPVVFPDARKRTIRILKGGGWFWAINIPDGTSLSYPSAAPAGPRIAVEGDSYTEGTGASAVQFGYINLLRAYLNAPDIWNLGSGGTGYVAIPASPAGRFNLSDRIQSECLDYDPDVVIVAAGLNDISSDFPTVVANAKATWNAVLAADSQPHLIVVGPFDPYANNAPLAQLDGLLGDAARGMGIHYISPTQDGGWIKGNAALLFTDGIHPNDDGHRLIAGNLAAHIGAIVTA